MIRIQERFEFRPGWYREDPLRSLTLEYYFALRSVLRAKPHLQPHRTRCRHCRIFFLTHPRNKGRRDLGCPFGCRDCHRKERSAARVKAYYATESGKKKKKLLNQKRGDFAPCEPEPHERGGRTSLELTFDSGMVAYVGVLTSLIEGRWVSRNEVLVMVDRLMRQHRMCRERRVDYVVRFLKENPP